ncbi:MAG: helix-turn-helix domain-containing protein [Akkermansiaceae bacterium]|jgi:excisionase family DNA binding protein|nr:helix-turn-helix domain-containing protein [Akkermansiaceae bacterium]
MENDTAPATPEKLDKPSEFAKVVNTTGQTVRTWVHQGIIPAKICLGRIIRIDRREALEALAAHSKGGAK